MSSTVHSLEVIERVRSLWGTGLSVRKIGLDLGLNKNVIVGIAYRNGFSKRPSPIGVRQSPKRRPCVVCEAVFECSDSVRKTCGSVRCVDVLRARATRWHSCRAELKRQMDSML